MSRVEEHEKRRLALPFIQQLSREVVRNCSCLGTLDRDCRYHIDRFLAAEALQARLRVFEIEGDWDDILKGEYGDGVYEGYGLFPRGLLAHLLHAGLFALPFDVLLGAGKRFVFPADAVLAIEALIAAHEALPGARDRHEQ